MTEVPPIRREILVEAEPATAFEVFTAGLGRWWPVGEFSVHGAGGAVSLDGACVGGQIVERSADGEPAVWGTVTRWEPPDVVAFTWHPGHGAERASLVEVTFAAAGSQTLVRLGGLRGPGGRPERVRSWLAGSARPLRAVLE